MVSNILKLKYARGLIHWKEHKHRVLCTGQNISVGYNVLDRIYANGIIYWRDDIYEV
jgi:hypothetical protein